MINRFSFILLFTLQVVVFGSAHAEKADSEKPTNVEADKMAYDDVKQVNTFSGGVVLTRGTLSMKAGKVVVTKDPAGYQFATLYAEPGSLASFRQKRDGPGDLWIEGYGERIEYDGKTEMVKLFSKARIKRLDGPKTIDEVEGAFISYDSRNEFFSVNNTASGVSKPGAGRISATIQPRTDTKEK
ncbi:MAG: lipopolysaccharide transport periplasmic protein LptA [Burkholderiaceae bacterium]